MRLEITYKNNGGAFAVEGEDEEAVIWLYNLAQKALWGNSAKSMTIEQADEWLGWSK